MINEQQPQQPGDMIPDMIRHVEGPLRIFNVAGVTGLDWWAYHLLSSRRMAIRVWRKLGGGRWVIKVLANPCYMVEGDHAGRSVVTLHAAVSPPGGM